MCLGGYITILSTLNVTGQVMFKFSAWWHENLMDLQTFLGGYTYSYHHDQYSTIIMQTLTNVPGCSGYMHLLCEPFLD